MPVIVPLIIIWVCVIAFILCMIGGLLVLFERWTPKNVATQRWLVGGLVVSVVGAVGTYANRQFGVEPTTQATASNSVGPSPSSSTPSGRVDATPPRPAGPPGTSGARAPESGGNLAVAMTPADVRDWAESTLGPRPMPEEMVSAPYPACVATLAALPEETVLRADATACRHELNRFHDRMLAVYNRKAPYEQNLEGQEEALGARRTDPDILPRYSYVLSEMARLIGASWRQFVMLDRRLLDDIDNCLRKCRA